MESTYRDITILLSRQQRDALLIGPPGVGKSHLAQAIGTEAIKAGFLVLYRSVFDLVRELSVEATQASEGRLLGKYLKPDLLIIDDRGSRCFREEREILIRLGNHGSPLTEQRAARRLKSAVSPVIITSPLQPLPKST